MKVKVKKVIVIGVDWCRCCGRELSNRANLSRLPFRVHFVTCRRSTDHLTDACSLVFYSSTIFYYSVSNSSLLQNLNTGLNLWHNTTTCSVPAWPPNNLVTVLSVLTFYKSCLKIFSGLRILFRENSPSSGWQSSLWMTTYIQFRAMCTYKAHHYTEKSVLFRACVRLYFVTSFSSTLRYTTWWILLLWRLKTSSLTHYSGINMVSWSA